MIMMISVDRQPWNFSVVQKERQRRHSSEVEERKKGEEGEGKSIEANISKIPMYAARKPVYVHL